jgi:hypothetical protein
MLRTLPQKLTVGLLGFAVLFSTATLLTTVTRYKPWGVPDVRRAEYEEKLTRIRSHNAKIDEFSKKDRAQHHIRKSSHDFGFVAAGQTLSHIFNVKNVGRQPLEIIAASVPKDVEVSVQQELTLPGSSNEVSLVWRPSAAQTVSTSDPDEQPSFQRSIELATNDPIHPSLKLTLTAKPKKKFECPKQLIFDPCSPGDSISHTFYLSSQTLDDFNIESVKCDAPGFFVDHEPVEDLSQAGRTSLTAAHRVFVRITPYKYGAFESSIKILTNANPDTEEHVVKLTGNVKTPITFNHPEMHRTRGLDLGTMSTDKQHQFHIQVRLRGEEHRSLEVLDWEPKELETSMTAQKRTGAYKLTITVPKDCRTVVFNRSDHRGFIKVGDPENPEFYNWLPFYGAVANLGDGGNL